jgi:hypothetical protein
LEKLYNKLKNMNQKTLAIFVIILTVFLLTSFFIHQNKENSNAKIEGDNVVSKIESVNSKTTKVIDPKTNMENTKYSDGRTSEVRTESYYADTIKMLDKDADLELFFFVMEYNGFEAVVSDKDGVFGQLPSNTMTRIKKNVAGQNFFNFADKLFQEKLSSLMPMIRITDRSIDTVSFDFVTNKGVYTVQESKTNLEKGNSIWSELYKKAKEVKPKN